MQVYIARDGVEIGEYPREQLNRLARAGELLPGDHYWYEGMADWLLLGDLLSAEVWNPPPARRTRVSLRIPRPRIPRPRLTLPVAIGVVVLFVLLLLIVFFTSGHADRAKTSLATPPPRPVETEDAVRDRAAADLKQKIDTLPARATPPMNTFYYDVNVNMNKSLERGTPWTATIAGSENVVDPASQETIRRTQFTLTADFHHDAWTYRQYHAFVTDPRTSATTEIYDDENAPIPPSIVGALGLKRGGH